MKFHGIGFNGPFLSNLPYKQFCKEVKHLLTKEEIRELYRLIKAKYKSEKPATDTESVQKEGGV